MRESLFKLLFKNEWDRLQGLIRANQNYSEFIVSHNKDIAIIKSYCKNPSKVDELILTEQGKLILEEFMAFKKTMRHKELEIMALKNKYKEDEGLRRSLEKYFSQLLTDESLVYDGELCAERDESEKAWSVCLSMCQVGGCELDSKLFKSKETAQVFASVSNILGYKMDLSICNECRKEFYE